MRWINVFCLIFIFPCATYSLENPYHQPDTIFLAGDSLFAEGKYFEAAIAYERVYIFSENGNIRAKANLSRARSLKQIGEFAKARNDLQRSLGLRGNPELHSQIMYEIAFLDYMAGNYTSSLSVLIQMEQLYGHLAIWQEAKVLYPLVYVMLEHWELALNRTLELIKSSTDYQFIADSLAYTAITLFATNHRPTLKSEERASLLSTFLPGVGHLYAGALGKGAINATSQLLSLGISGLLAYHKLYISGFIIGLGMFQMFYFGGVRQAEQLAIQHNLEEMYNYKSLLKDFILDIERQEW